MNDNSPAYLLHKLVFDLDRAADRLLQAEVGISYKRLLFLALVPPHGQLVQHELAQALGYSDPAVSTMLQTLTKEGYLTTSPSPVHGRKRLVTLTPRGRQLVTKSRRLLDARFAALLAAAGVDLDHFVALTTRISAVLNAPPGAGAGMTPLTANLTRQTVRSADGTTLNYYSTGGGPAVIVIPGALSLASDYAAFAGALGQQFTVHTLERRGHGQSGPQGEQYSLHRECEDVNALQAATGATRLVGHSFGGLVALEVARQTSAFCQVAVYEPGVSINGSISMAWMPGYQQKLARRQYTQAFVEYALATGPDRARRTPPWLMRLLLPLVLERPERETMWKLLPENLREHQALAATDSSYENYRAIKAEVLLLSGGQTGSAWVTLAMEGLTAVLPASQARVFPKLDHFGINKKAPVEVAAAVSEFFRKS